MQATSSPARRLLSNEANGLLARLARLKPFSLGMPMVAAASISPEALDAIEGLLERGRTELGRRIRGYLRWLNGDEGGRATPEEAQRRFTFLRMRFNSIVNQFDIFTDVLSQRGEHEAGVWTAGLDDVAADALVLAGGHFTPPPIVCYLDRGHGAAIRRARTRLPGGDSNPVAVIRVPRERMVGSGIASSLVHEVGHQGAALLDLVSSLRIAMPAAKAASADPATWVYWERWISEIVADLWSVARIGVGATLGLIAVVSLPRPFVFRLDLDDPHAAPYVRVKLSCALGQALYPHAQWERLAHLWGQLYPTRGLPEGVLAMFQRIERGTPEFVRFLLAHRPRSLSGARLGDVLRRSECEPERLIRLFRAWRTRAIPVDSVRPSLAFAAVGQARASGLISPVQESALLSGLLTRWALRSALRNAKRKPITIHGTPDLVTNQTPRRNHDAARGVAAHQSAAGR